MPPFATATESESRRLREHARSLEATQDGIYQRTEDGIIVTEYDPARAPNAADVLRRPARGDA